MSWRKSLTQSSCWSAGSAEEEGAVVWVAGSFRNSSNSWQYALHINSFESQKWWEVSESESSSEGGQGEPENWETSRSYQIETMHIIIDFLDSIALTSEVSNQ